MEAGEGVCVWWGAGGGKGEAQRNAGKMAAGWFCLHDQVLSSREQICILTPYVLQGSVLIGFPVCFCRFPGQHFGFIPLPSFLLLPLPVVTEWLLLGT